MTQLICGKAKRFFYAYFRFWRNINEDIRVVLSDSICQTQPKHLQIERWQYCLDSFWRWNILHISDFHAVYEVLQGAINGRKLWHFSRVIAKSKIYLSGSLNFELYFWLAFHTLHIRGKVQNLTIWKCWPAFHTFMLHDTAFTCIWNLLVPIIIYIINNVTLISVNLVSLKNLGDGGLMSQGRAAELPVTTDTNVPLMPAAVFPLFDHKRLQHYSLSFFSFSYLIYHDYHD